MITGNLNVIYLNIILKVLYIIFPLVLISLNVIGRLQLL